MSVHPFLSASTPTPSSQPGHSAIVLDTTWHQGRGAYGGLVSAIAVRAVQAHVPATRRLRSITVCFAAPAAEGPVAITVKTMREGARLSSLAFRLENSGGVIAHGSATLAAARALADDERAATSFVDAATPDVPPPTALEPVPADLPVMPRHARHFEWRFCHGELPWSGAARAEVGAWLRLRGGTVPVLDEALAVAFLDAMPPALLCRVAGPRPAASVEWTAQFFPTLPRALAAEEDVLVTARTEVAADGYAEELDRLWSADGALLAQARQTIALL